MAKIGIKTMQNIVTAYFADEKNKPFSIAGVCLRLGIDLKELKEWVSSTDPKLARHKELARIIRYTSLENWEKGEKNGGVPNTFYNPLLERYFEDEQNIILDENSNITVTVVDKI